MKGLVLIAMAAGTVALIYSLKRAQEEAASEPEALSDNIQSRLEELERRLGDLTPV